MNNLSKYKEELHSCSKCGLCQAVCPLYKATGNDCTVSRGQFVMLNGVLKGELKLSKKLNEYLDLCLKCGACKNFCPSDIDAVDIIISAKSEYFKLNKFKKIVSKFKQYFVYGFLLNFLSLFFIKTRSKKFDKKVLYFGGCKGKLSTNKSIVKTLNRNGVEVIAPNFNCCGITFLLNGDLEAFNKYIESYFKIVKKFGINEVVTSCASCEKILSDYKKWAKNPDEISDISVKNVYSYLRDTNCEFELKKPQKITFHKPCNISNYEDIKWLLGNIKNADYRELEEACCAFNGIFNFKKRSVLSKILSDKHNSILKTGANIVLTACPGCELSLIYGSKFKYKVEDLLNFLSKNMK